MQEKRQTKVQTATEETARAELPIPEVATNDLVVAAEETVLAERAEARLQTSLLDRLQRLEDGAKFVERRAAVLESFYVSALRGTNPEDWVVHRTDEGDVAIPSAAACDSIAEFYGLRFSNLRPVSQDGRFMPERIAGDGGVYTYRGWIDVFSPLSGRAIDGVEASRRSDEEFVGRDTAKVGDSDHRSAVLTLLRAKATRIVTKTTRVPIGVLAKAWEGSGKTPERCRKGHGFGSSASRRMQTQATPEVAASQEALAKEIFERVGGDTSAAKALLRDVTKSPDGKFAGFDDVRRMSKDWQFEQAWKNLRTHRTFGDGKAESAD